MNFDNRMRKSIRVIRERQDHVILSTWIMSC